MLERLWLDIRLAVRLWARTPGFSAIAIATIGLGVGATTALVGQVKAVFWTPLPVASPQDLRFVAWTSPRRAFVFGPNVMAGPSVNGTDTFGTVSYPAYLAMRTVRRAMTELNANTPTFSEAPVAEIVERRLRRERLLSSLFTVFASVTLCICCLGIYALIAYAVERRRQEISVRMAIGAQTSDVVALMVRESLVPVAAGLAIGAGLLVAANQWLTQVLYGVSSYDPLTFADAGLLFLLIAAAAAALPSRAATRVNPALALRQ